RGGNAGSQSCLGSAEPKAGPEVKIAADSFVSLPSQRSFICPHRYSMVSLRVPPVCAPARRASARCSWFTSASTTSRSRHVHQKPHPPPDFFTPLFTHPPPHSLIHSLTPSLPHPLTHSPIHSLAHSPIPFIDYFFKGAVRTP